MRRNDLRVSPFTPSNPLHPFTLAHSTPFSRLRALLPETGDLSMARKPPTTRPAKAPSEPVQPFSPLDPPPTPPVVLTTLRIKCCKAFHCIGLMTDGTVWRIDCPNSASEVQHILKYGNTDYTPCNCAARDLLYIGGNPWRGEMWWRARGSYKNRAKIHYWTSYLAHHNRCPRLADALEWVDRHKKTKPELEFLGKPRHERP